MAGFRGRPQYIRGDSVNRSPGVWRVTPGTVVRTVTQPPRDFVRGLYRTEPKYIPFGGASSGMRIQNRTASFTAGRQVKYLAGKATRFTLGTVPKGGVATAKYLIRSTVRDTLSPAYAATHAYQLMRVQRLARGRTTGFERNADKFLSSAGRRLDRFGLAPTLTGTLASGARITVIGSIIKGTDIARGRADEFHRTAVKYIDKAGAYASSFGTTNPNPNNGSVHMGYVPAGNTVVGSPPAQPIVPVTPPAPIPPRDFTGRKYIPNNGGRRR